MTDYLLGRQLPPTVPGVPSFWKLKEEELMEHALSPRNALPVCGYEGELKPTEERWYESKSKNKCKVCQTRTGDNPLPLGPGATELPEDD